MSEVFEIKTMRKNNNMQEMFNSIASKYDFLNHLLSFSLDKIWRKKTAKILLNYYNSNYNNIQDNKINSKILNTQKTNSEKYINILDVSTGTGDMALALAKKKNCKITGIDISSQMLKIAKEKIITRKLSSRICFQQADVANLPFEDNKFDACTIAFGCRNFEFLEEGLSEVYRVLKPTGKIIILEFSTPYKSPFKQIYYFYFQKILPLIGKIISKNKSAYFYLPISVFKFHSRGNFIKILEKAGFEFLSSTSYTFGVVVNYIASK